MADDESDKSNRSGPRSDVDEKARIAETSEEDPRNSSGESDSDG